MPRFFIDLQDGEDHHRDEEGSELEGLDQAQVEAVELLPQVARARLPGGEHRRFVATVRGEDGTLLYRASLTFQGKRL